MTTNGNYPGPTSQIKDFARSHWKTGLIVILSILITVILLRSCSNKPVTDNHVSIDSLININTASQHRYNELSDSINQVILEKDKAASELTKTIQAITYKYELIRHNRPNVDTIVKTHVVYQGSECLEKLPVIEAQLLNCESRITDYEVLVRIKTGQNITLQNQFDRAVSISRSQENDIKKLKRKNRWLKIGAVSGAVVIVGASIFVLAK